VKLIKAILAKYQHLVALLLPWGPWGVLAIATLDSAAFGMPLDFVVAQFVWADRPRFLLYCFMGALGSAVGSLVVYGIGYKGGEEFIVKRVGQARFNQICARFEKGEFLTLAILGILPPPTPFKLFVLGAGVIEMKVWRFLLSIFTGRMVRFLILSFLTIKFGPGVVGFLMHGHAKAKLIILAILIAAAVIWWVIRRGRSVEPSEEQIG
jgi:membrane protein YqaA with SNARE-associated domain